MSSSFQDNRCTPPRKVCLKGKHLLHLIMCCLYVVDSILCPAAPRGGIWHFIFIFKILRGVITIISFNTLSSSTNCQGLLALCFYWVKLKY